MGCFRIFDTNFVDEDIVANVDVSSEQSAFPKENFFNKNRRSKVWRTNGHWEITSSNNVIKFEETASTPLTATIAVDIYNSTSSFLTAIKTALDAAGISTYTVTTNSELKITITSNGAGGGGILNLLTTDGAMAGFAGIAGFDTGSDFTGSLSYSADVLKIHTDEYILFDLGISSNPQAFAMTGPRNDPQQISPTATLKLQANETNDFSTPSFETTIPYDDEVFVLMTDAGLADAQYRYWRVFFDDEENADGYVSAGAIFLGDWFSPVRGAPQFPFNSNYIDQSVTVFAEGGPSFADIKEQSQGFSFEMFGLTKDEVQDFTELFADLGTFAPFFVSLDSDAVFSTGVNRMVKYVKFAAEPTWRLERPNLFRATISFREEL